MGIFDLFGSDDSQEQTQDNGGVFDWVSQNVINPVADVAKTVYEGNIAPVIDTVGDVAKAGAKMFNGAGDFISGVADKVKYDAVDFLDIGGVKDESKGINDINKFQDYNRQINDLWKTDKERSDLYEKMYKEGVVNDQFFKVAQEDKHQTKVETAPLEFGENSLENFKQSLISNLPKGNNIYENQILNAAVQEMQSVYEGKLKDIQSTAKDLSGERRDEYIKNVTNELTRFKTNTNVMLKTFADSVIAGKDSDEAYMDMINGHKDLADEMNDIGNKLQYYSHSSILSKYFGGDGQGSEIWDDLSKGRILPALGKTISEGIAGAGYGINELISQPMEYAGLGNTNLVGGLRSLGITDDRLPFSERALPTMYNKVADIFNVTIGNAPYWLPTVATMLVGGEASAGIRGLKTLEAGGELTFLQKASNILNEEYAAHAATSIFGKTMGPKIGTFIANAGQDVIWDGMIQGAMGQGLTKDAFIENQIFNTAANTILSSIARPVKDNILDMTKMVKGPDITDINIGTSPTGASDEVLHLIDNGNLEDAKTLYTKQVLENNIKDTPLQTNIDTLPDTTVKHLEDFHSDINNTINGTIQDINKEGEINSILQSVLHNDDDSTTILRKKRNNKFINDNIKTNEQSSTIINKQAYTNTKRAYMSGAIDDAYIDETINNAVKVGEDWIVSKGYQDSINKAKELVKYNLSNTPTTEQVQLAEGIYKDIYNSINGIKQGVPQETQTVIQLSNRMLNKINTQLFSDTSKLPVGSISGTFKYLGGGQYMDIITGTTRTAKEMEGLKNTWAAYNKASSYHTTFGQDLQKAAELSIGKQGDEYINLSKTNGYANDIDAFKNTQAEQNAREYYWNNYRQQTFVLDNAQKNKYINGIYSRNGLEILPDNSIQIKASQLVKLNQTYTEFKAKGFNTANLTKDESNMIELMLLPGIVKKLRDNDGYLKALSDNGKVLQGLNSISFTKKYLEVKPDKTLTIATKNLNKDKLNKQVGGVIKTMQPSDVIKFLDEMKTLDISVDVIKTYKETQDINSSLKNYIVDTYAHIYNNEGFTEAKNTIDHIFSISTDIFNTFHTTLNDEQQVLFLYGTVGKLFTDLKFISSINTVKKSFIDNSTSLADANRLTDGYIRTVLKGMLFNYSKSDEILTNYMVGLFTQKGVMHNNDITYISNFIQSNKSNRLSITDVQYALMKDDTLKTKLLNGIDFSNGKSHIEKILESSKYKNYSTSVERLSTNNQTIHGIAEYLAAVSMKNIDFYNKEYHYSLTNILTNSIQKFAEKSSLNPTVKIVVNDGKMGVEHLVNNKYIRDTINLGATAEFITYAMIGRTLKGNAAKAQSLFDVILGHEASHLNLSGGRPHTDWKLNKFDKYMKNLQGEIEGMKAKLIKAAEDKKEYSNEALEFLNRNELNIEDSIEKITTFDMSNSELVTKIYQQIFDTKKAGLVNDSHLIAGNIVFDELRHVEELIADMAAVWNTYGALPPSYIKAFKKLVGGKENILVRAMNNKNKIQTMVADAYGIYSKSKEQDEFIKHMEEINTYKFNPTKMEVDMIESHLNRTGDKFFEDKKNKRTLSLGSIQNLFDSNYAPKDYKIVVNDITPLQNVRIINTINATGLDNIITLSEVIKNSDKLKDTKLLFMSSDLNQVYELAKGIKSSGVGDTLLYQINDATIGMLVNKYQGEGWEYKDKIKKLMDNQNIYTSDGPGMLSIQGDTIYFNGDLKDRIISMFPKSIDIGSKINEGQVLINKDGIQEFETSDEIFKENISPFANLSNNTVLEKEIEGVFKPTKSQTKQIQGLEKLIERALYARGGLDKALHGSYLNSYIDLEDVLNNTLYISNLSRFINPEIYKHIGANSNTLQIRLGDVYIDKNVTDLIKSQDGMLDIKTMNYIYANILRTVGLYNTESIENINKNIGIYMDSVIGTNLGYGVGDSIILELLGRAKDEGLILGNTEKKVEMALSNLAPEIKEDFVKSLGNIIRDKYKYTVKSNATLEQQYDNVRSITEKFLSGIDKDFYKKGGATEGLLKKDDSLEYIGANTDFKNLSEVDSFVDFINQHLDDIIETVKSKYQLTYDESLLKNNKQNSLDYLLYGFNSNLLVKSIKRELPEKEFEDIIKHSDLSTVLNNVNKASEKTKNFMMMDSLKTVDLDTIIKEFPDYEVNGIKISEGKNILSTLKTTIDKLKTIENYKQASDVKKEILDKAKADKGVLFQEKLVYTNLEGRTVTEIRDIYPSTLGNSVFWKQLQDVLGTNIDYNIGKEISLTKLRQALTQKAIGMNTKAQKGINNIIDKLYGLEKAYQYKGAIEGMVGGTKDSIIGIDTLGDYNIKTIQTKIDKRKVYYNSTEGVKKITSKDKINITGYIPEFREYAETDMGQETKEIWYGDNFIESSMHHDYSPDMGNKIDVLRIGDDINNIKVQGYINRADGTVEKFEGYYHTDNEGKNIINTLNINHTEELEQHISYKNITHNDNQIDVGRIENRFKSGVCDWITPFKI